MIIIMIIMGTENVLVGGDGYGFNDMLVMMGYCKWLSLN